jgi:hypothetical protein
LLLNLAQTEKDQLLGLNQKRVQKVAHHELVQSGLLPFFGNSDVDAVPTLAGAVPSPPCRRQEDIQIYCSNIEIGVKIFVSDDLPIWTDRGPGSNVSIRTSRNNLNLDAIVSCHKSDLQQAMLKPMCKPDGT